MQFVVLAVALTTLGQVQSFEETIRTVEEFRSPATSSSVAVHVDNLEVPATPKEQPADGESDASPAPTPSPEVAPEPAVVAELSDPRTRDFGTLGVTWERGTAPEDLVVEVRTRTEGEWTDWVELDRIEIDELEATRSGTDPVWVGESHGVRVRMVSAEAAPKQIEVVLIDGGTGLPDSGEFQEGIALASSETAVASEADEGDGGETVTAEEGVADADETVAASASSSGIAPMPTIVTRAEWGVDERSQSTCSSPATSSTFKGIVLHHTAGANGYTKEQSPGIVRGIHAYHTRSLGWCDVGYNFLVDAFGTTYEGRRGGVWNQVRGSHAGNWDANLYTSGISMMGNFDQVPVPKATGQAVTKLMAWKLSSFGRRAFGTYDIGGVKVPRISGHKDLYTRGVRPATATACPGRYGYDWLNSGARKRVQNRIDAAQTAEPAPSSSPTPSPTPAPSPSPSPSPEPSPSPTPTSAPVTSTTQTFWVPAHRTLQVRGRGFGHGRGMSQHGAQGAALQGLGYRKIADFYYPGTTLGKSGGKVRVLITGDITDDVMVGTARGLRVRDIAGNRVREVPVRAAITRWRIVSRNGRSIVQFYNGKWRRWNIPWARNIAGEAEFVANEPLTLWTPSGQVKYRGALRSASLSAGSNARDTVNILPLDAYLMGVVAAEIPVSWHLEAVKTQALAARTYAAWSRSQARDRYYDICDSTSCQVYGGVPAQRPGGKRAVRQTRAEVLLFDGKPAFTQFSASNGGWSTAGSSPYLRARQDPYDKWKGNTVHAWNIPVQAQQVEQAYPTIGRLRRIDVTSRDGNGLWQGRVLSLVLDGTQGRRTVSGDGFRTALGFRSTWFTMKLTPIIRRWNRIGGATASIGSPLRPEFAVAGGTVQRFEGGRIFHSPKTAPRELYGPIHRAYNRYGGPRSDLGFPRTSVRKSGKHLFARFQSGGIYQRRPGAPNVVAGAIHGRYLKAGAIRSLGWPQTSHYAIEGGERVDFGKASIVWNRNTGRTRIIWR